jgi:D-galactarolactone isomerase
MPPSEHPTGAPHSSGTAPPRSAVPEGACDAHLHILDPRFASAAGPTPTDMDIGGYRRLQARIGTRRAVIVQAKHYGFNNDCLLDAVGLLGRDGVGIAVVHPEVGDSELRQLHEGRVRGLRFSIWNPKDTVTSAAMIAPLAERIAPLGWHAQLHMSGDQIVAHAALLARLPCQIVIDHMGRLPPCEGTAHSAFEIMKHLLEAGRTWVKLSGAYLNTRTGPPDYTDSGRIARELIAIAPHRLVWGSDWPHITESHKPDDAQLIDLLADWCDDEATRHRILVDNPAALYGFEDMASTGVQA